MMVKVSGKPVLTGHNQAKVKENIEKRPEKNYKSCTRQYLND